MTKSDDQGFEVVSKRRQNKKKNHDEDNNVKHLSGAFKNVTIVGDNASAVQKPIAKPTSQPIEPSSNVGDSVPLQFGPSPTPTPPTTPITSPPSPPRPIVSLPPNYRRPKKKNMAPQPPQKTSSAAVPTTLEKTSPFAPYSVTPMSLPPPMLTQHHRHHQNMNSYPYPYPYPDLHVPCMQQPLPQQHVHLLPQEYYYQEMMHHQQQQPSPSPIPSSYAGIVKENLPKTISVKRVLSTLESQFENPRCVGNSDFVLYSKRKEEEIYNHDAAEINEKNVVHSRVFRTKVGQVVYVQPEPTFYPFNNTVDLIKDTLTRKDKNDNRFVHARTLYDTRWSTYASDYEQSQKEGKDFCVALVVESPFDYFSSAIRQQVTSDPQAPYAQPLVSAIHRQVRTLHWFLKRFAGKPATYRVDMDENNGNRFKLVPPRIIYVICDFHMFDSDSIQRKLQVFEKPTKFFKFSRDFSSSKKSSSSRDLDPSSSDWCTTIEEQKQKRNRFFEHFPIHSLILGIGSFIEHLKSEVLIDNDQQADIFDFSLSGTL